MSTPIFRFAPSPNGYLHLGHALSALMNFEMARAAGGTLLLRIEDIDETRCRPEYEQAIYEDLAWLGIAWEQPVRRQSEHLGDYRAALTRLEAQGLLYPSFESRAEIAALVAERERAGAWPRDPDGAPLYPGNARSIVRSPNANAGSTRANPTRCGSTWRQPSHAPARSSWTETGHGPGGETGTVSAAPAAWGDVVLARKETPTSYHLSVAGRRRAAGRDPCGARAGPVLCDQRPSFAADVARPARTSLSPPSSAAGCRRPKAVEIDPGDGTARTPRAGRDAGRYPPDGGTFRSMIPRSRSRLSDRIRLKRKAGAAMAPRHTAWQADPG